MGSLELVAATWRSRLNYRTKVQSVARQSQALIVSRYQHNHHSNNDKSHKIYVFIAERYHTVTYTIVHQVYRILSLSTPDQSN